MRKVITKGILFLIIVHILTIGLLIFRFSSRSREISKNEIVYLGDSHIQKGVITDSTNSLNIASTSETYSFSFQKLKDLIEQGKAPKQVIIGFDYHNLSDIFGDVKSGVYQNQDISFRYFPYLPFHEKFDILRTHGFLNYSFLSQMFNASVKAVSQKSKNDYWGGFKNEFESVSAVDSTIDKRVKFVFFKNDSIVRGFDYNNINDLKKIVVLAKEHSIKVRLIRIPMYYKFDEKVPDRFKFEYLKVINELKVDLIQCEFDTRDSDYFLPDGDHLTNSGAIAYKQILNKKLIQNK
ncbi:MAG: hypothetical protein K2P88_15135 [Chitinophagaceae bacterium]|nr:hypothetical protein [Chitinophagaceae bacterium]